MLELQDDDAADGAMAAEEEEDAHIRSGGRLTPQHQLLLHQTPTRYSTLSSQQSAWEPQWYRKQHGCKTIQLLERRRQKFATQIGASASSATADYVVDDDNFGLGAASEFAAVLGSSPAYQTAYQTQQQQPQQPLRCLWAGWVFMCWASGMMASAAFLLPYWLKGSRDASAGPDPSASAGRHLSDLGLFRLCAYPALTPDGRVQLVLDCGHYRHLSEIPSLAWRLAFALMAAASCLTLLLTFFLAFVGFRLAVLRIRPVLLACGAAQLGAAACILLTCLLYPLGWSGNPDVAQVCGDNAGAFRLGRCQLGWAFVLACASGFLAAATVAFPAQIGRHYLLPAVPLVYYNQHSRGTVANGHRRRLNAPPSDCSAACRQRQPLLLAPDSRPVSACTDGLPAAV